MNSKLKPISKLSQSRVTVVKRPSIRSDTYLLLEKPNETALTVRKNNPVKTSIRQLPVIKVPARSTSIPTAKRRVQVIHRNSGSQSLPKYVSTSIVRRDPVNKNIYLTKKLNGGYYSSSASDDLSVRPRRTRLANHEYIVQRRKPAVDYIYDDYHVETPIEKSKSQRIVHFLGDTPREDDGFYYLATPPTLRTPIIRTPVIRRATPTEYIHVEEAPASIRHRRSSVPEIVYVDEPQAIRYEDEYIYIDKDGHEVNYINEQKSSPRYVEYIYEDKKDKRRLHGSDIIYVDDKHERRLGGSEIIYLDDEPTHSRRPYKMKYKQPSSTRIIYE